MATWSLTSSAVGAGSVSGTLIFTRLAMRSEANGVGSTAAWPYVLNVLASPMGPILYFDTPDGWPKPALPGP